MTFRLRQRVGFIVLAGLLLMGLFTLGEGALAILGMVRFQGNFDEIAQAELPALVAAARLSELSHSIAASAPGFAAARTQITREAVAEQLSQELAALQRAVKTLEDRAVDPARIAAMQRTLDELVTDLRGLDGLVGRHIEIDVAYQDVLARVPPLVPRIREVSERAAGDPEPALARWAASALDATSLMLAAPAMENISRLARLRAEMVPVVAAMIEARDRLPPALQRRIAHVHDDIVAFSRGSGNILDNREREIEMEPALQLGLTLSGQSGEALAAEVAEIFTAVQQDVAGRAARLDRSVSITTLQIVALALLSAAAGTLIFLYVRRSVILRLRRLQDSMLARVDGRAAAIPTEGADEIAAMAHATAFFVETIEHREELLKRIFEVAPVALVLVRLSDQSVARTNQRALDLFGSIAAGPGSAPILFDTPEDFRALTGQLARAAFVDEIELRMRFVGGSGFWGLVAARSVTLDDEPHALIGTIDISVRKAAQDALRSAKEQAEAATVAKSTFLASISHELRTPLNAIIGLTEILCDHPARFGTENALEPLRRVRNAGGHLLGLINDVLDLSKIEAGKMDLEVELVDVAALVEEARETVEGLAEQRGNRLTVDCPAGLPRIATDPLRLRQILLNLLGNACKFTEHGFIALRVTLLDLGDRRALELTVADTGIGIAPEHLPRLFEEFAQGDGSTARRFGGTGLGLAISRRLCRLLGGEISAESVVGRGSTFRVRLPLTIAATAAAAPSANLVGEPAR
jgi:two-component system sensor histidine kinase/response regulator